MEDKNPSKWGYNPNNTFGATFFNTTPIQDWKKGSVPSAATPDTPSTPRGPQPDYTTAPAPTAGAHNPGMPSTSTAFYPGGSTAHEWRTMPTMAGDSRLAPAVPSGGADVFFDRLRPLPNFGYPPSNIRRNPHGVIAPPRSHDDVGDDAEATPKGQAQGQGPQGLAPRTPQHISSLCLPLSNLSLHPDARVPHVQQNRSPTHPGALPSRYLHAAQQQQQQRQADDAPSRFGLFSQDFSQQQPSWVHRAAAFQQPQQQPLSYYQDPGVFGSGATSRGHFAHPSTDSNISNLSLSSIWSDNSNNSQSSHHRYDSSPPSSVEGNHDDGGGLILSGGFALTDDLIHRARRLDSTSSSSSISSIHSHIYNNNNSSSENSDSDSDDEKERQHQKYQKRLRLEQQKALAGIAPGYGGDPFNPANQSADVPDDENTALWMTNLPPDCDHAALLGAIRGCGKVYACVVNPPTMGSSAATNKAVIAMAFPEMSVHVPATGGNEVGMGGTGGGGPHMTAAAKVVFFDREGAANLLRLAHEGRFQVGGFVPRVRRNRIRSAARDLGPQCRVLHIEGPPALVNLRYLLGFFGARFTFELESVRSVGSVGGSPGLGAGAWSVATAQHQHQRVRQEWRFGSYRCQAEAARQALHREKERQDLPPALKALWDQVNVHFGVDPCA